MKLVLNKFQWLFFMAAAIGLLAIGLIIGRSVEIGFGLAGALLLFLLFWYDIRIGLWLSLASILGGQIVRISLTSGGILLSDGVLSVLMVVWVFYWLFKGFRIRWNIVWLALVGFWLVSLVMNIIVQVKYPAYQVTTMWLYWFRLFVYSMYLPVVWHITSWYGQARRFMNWWLVMGAVFLLLGFLQLIFVPDITFLAAEGWDPHMGRLLSTFLDPNFAGALLVLLFGVCFSMYFKYRRWDRSKLFWGILAGLTAVGVILTLSRSAYLGLGAVFLILSWLFDKRLILVGLLAGSIFVMSDQRIYERVEGIVTVDETAQFRIKSWTETMDIIQDNFWTGVGYNALGFENFRRGNFIDLRKHNAAGSDSTVLTIWATMGWLGMLMFMMIFVSFASYSIWIFFRSSYDWQLRYFALGLVAGIIGVFIHSQFTNSLLYAHILLPVFYGMGLVLGWAEIDSSSKQTVVSRQ